MGQLKVMQAIREFQKECPTIAFDSRNPHFKSKYASLKAIHKIINPILDKHGLWIIQPAIGVNGQAGCKTVIYHESGESIEESFMVSVKAEDPQKACAAVTYARRYGLSAMLGLLTDEDDDGNSASSPSPAVKNAGKPAASGTGAKSTAKGITKPSQAKLKHAAEVRADSIGDPGTPWLKIVQDCAKELGYSSHIELLESDFERMFHAIQMFGPPDEDEEGPIPF